MFERMQVSQFNYLEVNWSNLSEIFLDSPIIGCMLRSDHNQGILGELREDWGEHWSGDDACSYQQMMLFSEHRSPTTETYQNYSIVHQVLSDVTRKTTPERFLEIQLITASVSFSQPRSLWELAWLFLTVRHALRRRTPWSAQPPRYPCPGRVKPGMSRSSSLKMLTRLGGAATPGFTEKHSPCACQPISSEYTIVITNQQWV